MVYLMPSHLCIRTVVDKEVRTFSKVIIPKLNEIARQDFELAYNDVAI